MPEKEVSPAPWWDPKMRDILILPFHNTQLCLVQTGSPQLSPALGRGTEEVEGKYLSFGDMAQRLHTSLGIHVICLKYVLNTTVV